MSEADKVRGRGPDDDGVQRALNEISESFVRFHIDRSDAVERKSIALLGFVSLAATLVPFTSLRTDLGTRANSSALIVPPPVRVCSAFFCAIAPRTLRSRLRASLRESVIQKPGGTSGGLGFGDWRPEAEEYGGLPRR